MSKFHSYDNPPFSCLRIAYPVPPGRTSSGSLAKCAAMRRASSLLSSFAAKPKTGDFSCPSASANGTRTSRFRLTMRAPSPMPRQIP